jgi:outer membrane biosynthesis protein TonB
VSARDGNDLRPSLVASFLLHAGLLVATLVAWPWFSKPMHLGASVPVTIVSTAPEANVRPAEQAPVEEMAATPEPTVAPPEPIAPPTPAPPAPPVKSAPAPAPKPQPAKTQPKPVTPKPVPTPAPPQPAPKKAAPAPKKQPLLDLDALAASIRTKPSGKSASGGAKGPPHPERAAQARPAVGQASALAASALSNLSADLARRWNPNCEVEGGANVDIRVAMKLDEGGNVVGSLEATGQNSSDPVVKAAADRAVRAIRAAEPFQNLPAELYGERIIIRFNARSACATG